MFRKLNSPIFVALDVDNDKEALHLARNIEPYVGGFKVGPRLCFRYGASFISELAKYGHVFVDNKYFDIPNTMIHAVRAAFDGGATFVSIHAQAGRVALTELAKLEQELNRQRPFRLLAVTVLTSFNQEDLPPNAQAQPIAQQVESLAELSVDCGLAGLVCSPHEVSLMKSKFPGAFVFTPGIRFQDGKTDDQKRIMGPKEAMKAGATALVVGRPIVEAEDPRAAAKQFYEAVIAE